MHSASLIAARTLEGLLEQAGRGDRVALAAFYDRTVPQVMHLVGWTGQDHPDAAVLEIYLTAWRSATNYNRRTGSALAWLLTIAYRHIVEVALHPTQRA